MEKLISLAKQRGFVYPSSEVYGGIGGFYDYGPLGVQLKRNIERHWWKRFVESRPDMVGVESSIIMNPKVWEASGHLASFTDPLVECKVCHERFRADHLDTIQAHKHQGQFTDPREFQLMFKTFVGPVEDASNVAYLRPETAQGMFTNFSNVLTSSRQRVPFGIAQIGKSFRNEITYRNFLFRLREFTIAELEYFVKPGDDERAFDEWLELMRNSLINDFGLKPDHLQLHEHPKDTLAHYSKRTVDFHYKFPWGWDELWGLANRTDYDLAQHEKASGKKFIYRDPESGETYRPFVIEPTGGIDRLLLAILVESYYEIEGGRTTTTESNKEMEVVLRIPKLLAPIQIAVLPLSKKEPLSTKAKEIVQALGSSYIVNYDDVASIGRRYRRQDEVGTPYCLTIDFDTMNDSAVTVRDRDTMEQERIAVSELPSYFLKKFND
jgi:glycyl-tRNA synthetase